MRQNNDYKKAALKAVAKGVRGVAEMSAGPRCFFSLYEPKVPEALRTKEKRNEGRV